MPKELVINNVTFSYPVAGEDPSWGQDASDWAEAVTNAINTLLGSGDILQTTFSVADNTAVASNINGLLFDPTDVRAANITYSVYRTCTDVPSGKAETGTIYLIYDSNASAGSKWGFSQVKDGDAGIVFSITDAGQIQYITSQLNAGAGGYTGTMKFFAKSLAT